MQSFCDAVDFNTRYKRTHRVNVSSVKTTAYYTVHCKVISSRRTTTKKYAKTKAEFNQNFAKFLRESYEFVRLNGKIPLLLNWNRSHIDTQMKHKIINFRFVFIPLVNFSRIYFDAHKFEIYWMRNVQSIRLKNCTFFRSMHSKMVFYLIWFESIHCRSSQDIKNVSHSTSCICFICSLSHVKSVVNRRNIVLNSRNSAFRPTDINKWKPFNWRTTPCRKNDVINTQTTN